MKVRESENIGCPNMKKATRFAGLFASIAFMFTGIPGYMATMDPLHALMYALLSSAILGMIGFKLGDILDNPKGTSRKSGSPRFMQELLAPPKTSRSKASVPVSAKPSSRGLTGEETLLDDIDIDN